MAVATANGRTRVGKVTTGPEEPDEKANMEEKQLRVAIVEDHTLVRVGLEELVRKGHLRVTWSGGNMDDFLAVAGNDIDVLLLDIFLNPASNEPVSESKVRATIKRGIPVLVVSAVASGPVLARLAKAGVSGFVSKAEPPEVLLEAINTVARGGTWIKPGLLLEISHGEEPLGPSLNAQELRVLRLYVNDVKINTIARELNVSPHTIRYYIKMIRAKFSAVGRPASTKTELYRNAVELGLTTADCAPPPGYGDRSLGQP